MDPGRDGRPATVRIGIPGRLVSSGTARAGTRRRVRSTRPLAIRLSPKTSHRPASAARPRRAARHAPRSPLVGSQEDGPRPAGTTLSESAAVRLSAANGLRTSRDGAVVTVSPAPLPAPAGRDRVRPGVLRARTAGLLARGTSSAVRRPGRPQRPDSPGAPRRASGPRPIGAPTGPRPIGVPSGRRPIGAPTGRRAADRAAARPGLPKARTRRRARRSSSVSTTPAVRSAARRRASRCRTARTRGCSTRTPVASCGRCPARLPS